MNTQFNLEAFKAGQKAKYIGGNDVISFIGTASDGRIVYDYENGVIGRKYSKDMTNSFEMISRHQ